MKKAYLRVPCLILAVLMSVSVFAGCGPKKPADTESQNSSQPTGDLPSVISDVTSESETSGDITSSNVSSGTSSKNSTNSKITRPKPQDTVSSGVHQAIVVNKDINLKGQKVTISYWDQSSVPTEGKNEIEKKRWKRIQNAQKKYNFKFDYKVVQGDNYKTQVIASCSAGKKFADIINHPSVWSYPTWFANKFFEPLDAYIDYTNDKYKHMDTVSRFYDGKHYGIVDDNTGPRIVLYNTDMLKKAGCADPLVLAQEGKWNWDTFLEIAKKTTIVENGKTVQYGVGPNMFTALLESNGIMQARPENGKLVFGLDTPAALKTLNFFHELNTKHKVTQIEFPADLWKGFRDGKVAMQWGYLWEVKLNVYQRRCTIPYKIVPVPLGPDMKERQVLIDNVGYTSFAKKEVTPFKTNDLLAIYLDAYGTGEKSEPDTYVDPYKGFKITYDKVFKSEEELDYFWEVWQDSETYYSPTGGSDASQAGGLIWLNIMSPLLAGEETPAVLVNKNKKKIQAALDSLLKL